MDLVDIQVNLTCDVRTGETTGYLLLMTPKGQWHWVDDAQFGPFDTTLDIATWVTRALRRALEAPVR